MIHLVCCYALGRFVNKRYFVKPGVQFHSIPKHLECPTTLDRWKRFRFKPLSNREIRYAAKLFGRYHNLHVGRVCSLTV